MLISFFLMIIISTSLTVPTQPSPRFHVEAWLPFRNCEKDYSGSICIKAMCMVFVYMVHVLYRIHLCRCDKQAKQK